MPDGLQEAFDTRTAYLQAIDAVLSAAKREICVFDPDMRNLDFDSRTRSDAIALFLAEARDRRLRIILHDLNHLNRYSPRMMGLLKRFSHCLSIHQTPESLRHLTDCFMLADAASGVIRFHTDYFRGKLLLGQPNEIRDWQQRFEELWLESIPGATATHLGL